jgi:hypothetical protein
MINDDSYFSEMALWNYNEFCHFSNLSTKHNLGNSATTYALYHYYLYCMYSDKVTPW